MVVESLDKRAILVRNWTREYELLLYARQRYEDLSRDTPEFRRDVTLKVCETAESRLAQFEQTMPADLVTALKAFFA